jgi:Na+/melibiose symporter-like transporter
MTNWRIAACVPSVLILGICAWLVYLVNGIEGANTTTLYCIIALPCLCSVCMILWCLSTVTDRTPCLDEQTEEEVFEQYNLNDIEEL